VILGKELRHFFDLAGHLATNTLARAAGWVTLEVEEHQNGGGPCVLAVNGLVGQATMMGLNDLSMAAELRGQPCIETPFPKANSKALRECKGCE